MIQIDPIDARVAWSEQRSGGVDGVFHVYVVGYHPLLPWLCVNVPTHVADLDYYREGGTLVHGARRAAVAFARPRLEQAAIELTLEGKGL
jgi:hypothetical protein